uniref:Uncharacterized protein n=1 Tax=Gasterosteus aculeatus TaxID=69293 RepID=G3Q1T6_GASAC
RARSSLGTVVTEVNDFLGLHAAGLTCLVTPYCPTRQLRSIDAGLLVVPMVLKSRLGARAFSYQAPLLWNQVPLSVRGADSVSTFSPGGRHSQLIIHRFSWSNP